MPYAFPTDEYFNETRIGQFPGMDLRDWFAGQALADLACYSQPHDAARWAYEMADAMMAERAKNRRAAHAND
jgi:hypothetical protein